MYFKLALRYLKTYKKRAFVIFISLFISVLIISTNGIMQKTANNVNLLFLEKDNRFHMTINNVNRRTLEYLRENNQIEEVNVEFLVDASEIYSEYLINLIGVSDFSKIEKLKSGKIPKNEDEVVVQEWILKSIQKNIGDSIGFESHHKKKMVYKKIVGVLEDNENDKSKNVFELYTFNTKFRKYNTVGIIINDKNKINKIAQNIKVKLFDEFGVDKKEIHLNKEIIKAYEKNGDTSFELIKIIITSVLFSSLIVFSTFFISIRNRIEEFGILRAMGIADINIFRLIASELIIILIPAIIFGSLVSVKSAKYLIDQGKNYYGEIQAFQIDNYIIGFPIKIFVLSMLFLSIFVILISFVTYLLSVKGNPIDTMNSMNKTVKFKKVARLKRNNKKDYKIKDIGIVTSLRYMRFDFIVVSLILLSIAITSSELVMQSYDSYVMKALMDKSDYYSSGDLLVSQNNPNNDKAVVGLENIKKIEEDDRVKRSIWMDYRYSTMDIPKNMMKEKGYFDELAKEGYNKEVLKGIYKENKSTYTIKNGIVSYNEEGLNELRKHILKGKIDKDELKNEDKCVLYYPQQFINLKSKKDERNRILNYNIGDEIEIKIPKKLKEDPGNPDIFLKYWRLEYIPDLVIKKYKIAAIVDYMPIKFTYGPSNSTHVIISDDKMREIFSDSQYKMGAIYLKNANKSSEVLDYVSSVLKDNRGLLVTDSIKMKMMNEMSANSFINSYNIKLYSFILICIICFINIVSYKIMNKKNDFGVLMALGMTDGDFKNMVATEGMIYALCGTLASWGITIFRQIYANKIYEVESHITGLDLSVSVWLYLSILLINLVVCLLAVYIPTKKILKDNITDNINNIE